MPIVTALGAVDGTALGAVDGTALGAVDGTALGAVDGTALGAVDGAGVVEVPLEQAATRASDARTTPKAGARRLMVRNTVVHTSFLVACLTQRGTNGGAG
jgi:outer membrane lipoprotein SlyB